MGGLMKYLVVALVVGVGLWFWLARSRIGRQRARDKAGTTGGAGTVALTTPNLPSHTHTVPNHTHGGVTYEAGNHVHGILPSGNHAHGISVFGTASGAAVGGSFSVPRFDGGGSPIGPATDGAGDHTHLIDAAGDHAHALDIFSGGGGVSGSAGSGQAHENRPPFRSVLYAIRV